MPLTEDHLGSNFQSHRRIFIGANVGTNWIISQRIIQRVRFGAYISDLPTDHAGRKLLH